MNLNEIIFTQIKICLENQDVFRVIKAVKYLADTQRDPIKGAFHG